MKLYTISSLCWGAICLWYLHVFSALVFPYIFLLFDCFEWALIDCIEKHRGHSELWQFQGEGSSAFGIYMFSLQWYFLISSYYLTVSNGHSLTALKSIEVTQSCDSFKWGGGGEGGPPWTHTLTNKQSDLKSRSLH